LEIQLYKNTVYVSTESRREAKMLKPADTRQNANSAVQLYSRL